MNFSKYTIGIVSSIFDSFTNWSRILEDVETIIEDGKTYYAGYANGVRIIILGSSKQAVTSSWLTYPALGLGTITHLVYMGYAGAVNENIELGDFVVATRLMTFDELSNPQTELRMKKHKSIDIAMNSQLSSMLHSVACECISESVTDPFISNKHELLFGLNAVPAIFRGLVGVGDPFFISKRKKQDALMKFPQFICLEEEGFVVPTVAKQLSLPLGMIHIIVQAHDKSEINYTEFITEVANTYMIEICQRFIRLFSKITYAADED